MASDTPSHRTHEGGEDAGTASSGSGRSSRELRVDAPAFVPPAQVCRDASGLVFNRDANQNNDAPILGRIETSTYNTRWP